MNTDRNRRLWEQRRIVLVRFYAIDMIPYEGKVLARARFRHPCPCEGWRLDKEFYASFSFDEFYPYSDKERLKEFRLRIRVEAAKHVREFLNTGLVDGVPRP